MCQAITKVAEELVAWCDTHPNSYPPTVLHITDGESTDGDPENMALQLQQIQTSDGLRIIWGANSDNSLKIKIYKALLALPENSKIKLMDLSDPTKPTVK